MNSGVRVQNVDAEQSRRDRNEAMEKAAELALDTTKFYREAAALGSDTAPPEMMAYWKGAAEAGERISDLIISLIKNE